MASFLKCRSAKRYNFSANDHRGGAKSKKSFTSWLPASSASSSSGRRRGTAVSVGHNTLCGSRLHHTTANQVRARFARPVPVDIAALHPRKPMMICQCDHLWQMKGLERNGPQETPGLAMNVVVSLVLLRAKTKLIKWNAHCVIWKSAKT